jgi:hypothetical protein
MKTARSALIAVGVALFAPGTSRAAAAERETFLSSLPPAPRPRGPAPAAEEDEHARRPWEFLPALGAGTPICYGSSGPLCSAQAAGFSIGLSTFFRLTPYVALGLSYQRLSGSIDSAALAPGVSGTASSDFFGLIARGYFLDRGAFDPYVQAGFGRGSFGLDMTAGGAPAGGLRAAAPATEISAGADFWIGSFMKIGPQIGYFWTFLGDVRACGADGDCGYVGAGSLGIPGTELVLGLSLTIAAGSEM